MVRRVCSRASFSAVPVTTGYTVESFERLSKSSKANMSSKKARTPFSRRGLASIMSTTLARPLGVRISPVSAALSTASSGTVFHRKNESREASEKASRR